MTVTVQEVMDAGIFPMATDEDVMWVQAGLDWLDVCIPRCRFPS